LKNYRVYLDNILLKNIPNGLDMFQKEFKRDNDLYGIYSISSYDLVFVGDGYCILRDFQDNIDSCTKSIKVQENCNNIWVDVFDGIIEVGSVEINESASEATCTIEDNSPLALMVRNSEADIDLQTTIGLYNNAITPINELTVNLSSPLATPYTGVFIYDYTEALRVVLESITGLDVNVQSTFLAKQANDCIYDLEFTGDMSQFIDATIVYKNFQGQTITVNATNVGGAAELFIIGYYMMPFSLHLGAVAANFDYVQNAFKNDLDHRDFYYFTPDYVNNKIRLFSNLPIEILSTSINSFDITATIGFTKIQDFEDGGNNPCLSNYRLLHAQNDKARFSVNFKTLMSELHKLFNVYFIASYNNQGGIDFRVEDYQYFANAAVNMTFDNAQDLKVSFDEENIANSITTGEATTNNLGSNEFTFATEFCGLGQNFDAKNDFVIGAWQIFEDLKTPFKADKENEYYIIENYGDVDSVFFAGNPSPALPNQRVSYAYNMRYTNYHKIYRHFNKFRNSVKGNISVPWIVTEHLSNINIDNTANNRLFRIYEFNEYMSRTKFNSLIDSNIDKVQFKKTNDSTYREGLIKSVFYNDLDGKAQIVILGE